jgi:hypothetical protein
MTLRDCQCDRAECPFCGPLVLLAEEIRREFEHTRVEARVPTPEIVWWKAQMRAREEAGRKAARPILFTQALAIAALIGLLVSVAGRVTLSSISWPAIDVLSAPQTLPLLPIVIVAGCWLILAPIALYYAFSRD